MNTYLITYELKNKIKDYTSFYQAIKSLGAWWHYLDSTWIVKVSDQNAKRIFDSLKPHIDTSLDYIFVIKIDSHDREGWLPRGAWDWINK